MKQEDEEDKEAKEEQNQDPEADAALAPLKSWRNKAQVSLSNKGNFIDAIID